MNEPRIVAEETDYLVVFKPSGMHAAPLAHGEGGTLLDWCARRFPDVLLPKGRKPAEGGLLHRLDRETEGLTVIARNQGFYDALALQQEEGFFIKEYRAVCLDYRMDGDLRERPPGFPSPPKVGPPPCTIESAFRPFGPGRRVVRPVIDLAEATETGRRRRTREIALDRGRFYRTELLELDGIDETYREIRVRLARGFRHQVRCHLAWIGFPIRGDGLYGRSESTTPQQAAGYVGSAKYGLYAGFVPRFASFESGFMAFAASGRSKLRGTNPACESTDVSLSLSAIAVSFLDPTSSSPLRYECSSSIDSERIS